MNTPFPMPRVCSILASPSGVLSREGKGVTYCTCHGTYLTMHLHWQTMEAVCVCCGDIAKFRANHLYPRSLSKAVARQNLSCLSISLSFSLSLPPSLTFCLSAFLSVCLSLSFSVRHVFSYLHEVVVVKAH